MKLVVGLGNAGKEYENTRHNVGFIVLDSYNNGDVWKTSKESLILEKNINGEKVIFLKPLTYMNLSGKEVVRVANFYKISNEDILVVHDDLDLEIGRYKVKFDSSSGGHNGIKNIIQLLGTSKFARLKIGIGNNKNIDTKGYVLDKMSHEELKFLQGDLFKEIIDSFLIKGIDRTMNEFNRR